MNAFVSHAIHPSEQYIVSLLAKKLADNQVGVITSFIHHDRIDLALSAQIRNAAIFIGLVTKSAQSFRKNQVFTEFQFALQNQRPCILLIEQGTAVPTWLDQHVFIVFNRLNIDEALQNANYQIELAKQAEQGRQNAAWLLGGVAVLALLSLLSNDKK